MVNRPKRNGLNVEKPARASNEHFAAQRMLGRTLIEEGIATAAQVTEALHAAQEGGHLLLCLVGAGHLTHGAMHDFLSKQPGIAAIDISQYNVERGLANLIPADFARERMVMPVDALGKLLTVAMACPLDTKTIAEVEGLTGRRVKAMLCRSTELMKVIEKQYPEEETPPQPGFEGLNLTQSSKVDPGAPAKSDTVEKLRALESLPLSPAALQRCESLFGGGEASVIDVCDFVSEQPSLAATALRSANSEAFGLRGQVGSVALACSVLGVDTVRAIALDSGASAGGFDLEAHARESAICGLICSEIARTCGRDDAGRLHAAGLLQAIGRVALAEVNPHFYAALQQMNRSEWAQRELRHFGLSFAEAGYELLDAWGVSPALAGAVRDQLDPASSEAHRDTAAILACARVLTNAHLSGGANPAADPRAKALFETAGIEPAIAGSILTAIANPASK